MSTTSAIPLTVGNLDSVLSRGRPSSLSDCSHSVQCLPQGHCLSFSHVFALGLLWTAYFSINLDYFTKVKVVVE